MKKLIFLMPLVFLLVSCKESNSHNGYEWVDLGLPSGTKWATCNVGAKSLAMSGSYFAWGEVRSKREYSATTCLTIGKKWESIGGYAGRDAARAFWGGNWQMPSARDFQELIDECIWEWTIQDNSYGYKVMGPNGNSIFFPVTGLWGGFPPFNDEHGYYQSSTPDGLDNAYILYFGNDVQYVGTCPRHLGLCIRPVLKD